ncbi:hypothetical protein [Hymenobacter sublimis]|uniref:Uncharacterized protein n=1 Tax=Hymenobacter sublimis TaxID=2933777 RepID=A0ABY4JBP0_9BACT|nr:hypothetical protein [Hymenobacter sublimis]UPL50245.1 hypothetical protein MWH26_04895 [Hymenobacter sublimis]
MERDCSLWQLQHPPDAALEVERVKCGVVRAQVPGLVSYPDVLRLHPTQRRRF